MIDITEFYAVACEMVKAWPATYPVVGGHEYLGKRPQGFGVLRSLLDLEADNFAKSIEHARPPYLFIRDYAANEYRTGIKVPYPFIGCAEDTMTFFHATGGGSQQKDRNKINLFCIDQIPFKEGGADPYSTARTIEEIGRDLRQMMKRFLASLRRWEYVEMVAGPYATGWHDVVWLRAHGDPDAQWNTQERMVDVLMLVSELSGDVIYQGSDGNVVLITNIYIDTQYCPPPLEFNYKYDDAGFLVQPVEKWTYDK